MGGKLEKVQRLAPLSIKMKKKPQSKKKSVWEQEASLFSNAKGREGQKGFNLNTAGLIRGLHNFLKTAPIEPVTKRDKRGNIHLNFIGTAHRWIDEVHNDCNYEDVAGAYSNWRQDQRTFICERDIVENNYPDYQVLGGKIGAKKQVNIELDKKAYEISVEGVGETYESYENEKFEDWEKKGLLDNYENLEIDEDIF
jgi:hypothetical protein